MIDDIKSANPLSTIQMDAMKKLTQRMAAILTWPQNKNNPAQTGFTEEDHKKLALLLEHPEYASLERLEEILIPMQDYFLAQIDQKNGALKETAKAINHMTGNVRPLFEDVVIPETDKLLQSYRNHQHRAEQSGYMISLIATIINPPCAQVYYPEFGRK